MRKRILSFSCFCILAITSCSTPERQLVWNIGVADSSTVDLALGPDRYKEFLANDFGFEDRYYLVGKSDDQQLSGREDTTGSGWERCLYYRWYEPGQTCPLDYSCKKRMDEDLGQMSALLIMASLELFQTDGGCSTEPVYEIASPLYAFRVFPFPGFWTIERRLSDSWDVLGT